MTRVQGQHENTNSLVLATLPAYAKQITKDRQCFQPNMVWLIMILLPIRPCMNKTCRIVRR